MTPRGPDAGTLLVRALRTLGADFAVRIDSIAARPWASATFAGMRHTICLTAPAVPGLRSWLDGLPGADMPLRGHLVADLCVDALVAEDGVLRATLAVLTLEDR